MALKLPGVSVGLRRMQAAAAGGYGSIASRNDPNRYGSILSRTYPGLFGPDTQPSGQDEQNTQTDQLIKNNQRVLDLRAQRVQLSRSPEEDEKVRLLRNQSALRRYTQQLNPNNIDLSGYDDEEDDF